MEKQEVTEVILSKDIYDGDLIPINQLISDLTDYARTSARATHIRFDISESYGSISSEMVFVKVRPETDAEYEKRTAEERAREERNKRYELEQLAKLKAKYENG